MPKSKTKFRRNPDSWQCNRRLCSRASRWQFSTKNSITSDAATCRNKRPRSQGSRKPLSQRMARFIDGHQKQGWVGAGDSFERRMADVAESFVNRRVQFCQHLTNAAQITFDNNNTDNEQVSCKVYKDKPSIWITGWSLLIFCGNLKYWWHLWHDRLKTTKNTQLFSSHRSTTACSGRCRFIPANSAWPSLRRSVQSVLLMITVL